MGLKRMKNEFGKKGNHKQKFEKFLTDGLNIDPDNIEVADFRRLP